MVGLWHGLVVAPRRVRVLAGHVASLIPPGATVLDVGAGDGRIAAEVLRLRPDVTVEGIDVLVRRALEIPVTAFDGRSIPRATASVDVVALVDVLHHAEDPLRLLAEAVRVARTTVVIKDHVCESAAGRRVLQLMDWAGNARFGVALPYAYWSEAQWRAAMTAVGAHPTVWRVGPLGLYPWPASLVFERGLHVLACLSPRAA